MNERKKKLEASIANLEKLIDEVNTNINYIGELDSYLLQALEHIQDIFDRIRNVPEDKIIKSEEIKKIYLTWKQQVEQIENDYETASKVQLSNGAAGTSFGVGVATLGPTAAMGFASAFGTASTGTAISSLSGAVARNAALAWLGGGTVAGGGGGMAAGNAILGMAGPIGWSIAFLSFCICGFSIWNTISNKHKLEELFLLISKRDTACYKQALIEISERSERIKDETNRLVEGAGEIETFGCNYNSMTEKQQYTLGVYVNLMFSSAKLLVTPIQGLRQRFTIQDVRRYVIDNNISYRDYEYYTKTDIILYLGNLLYNIDMDEDLGKLLMKSLRSNKEFLRNMGVDKDVVDIELYKFVHSALYYKTRV